MKKVVLNHLVIEVITVFLSVFQISVLASNYKIIRISDDIELIKLSKKAYVHVSVSEIASFGKFSSNGLILVNGDEAFLFDTPVTNSQTEILVKWMADTLSATVSTFVPKHWHDDCLGGLETSKLVACKSMKEMATKTEVKTEITDKHWKLVELSGISGETNAHIIFRTDGTVSGDFGCNGFHGAYVLQEESWINFDKLLNTQKMCFDTNVMNIESEISRVLQIADNYNLTPTLLVLNRARMASLARFE